MKKPNKINKSIVIFMILSIPIWLTSYLVGAIIGYVYMWAFCGFKETTNKISVGLGYESNEQIIERLIKEKL